MKALVPALILCLLVPALSSAEEWLTVAESSGFESTSLYSDVTAFVAEAQRRSDKISVSTFATSTEGRPIDLVCVSQEGIRSPQEAALYGKPVVLIIANIHAGEVDGKEAVLMLLREIANGEADELLRNQVILLVPIFNPDGNDKLDPGNRRDNGPEAAGVRHNGQHLDLNRDFIKLESPEVRGLLEVINAWQPLLFVDLHTTNGSYHQEPVTYTTLGHPSSSALMMDYMWGSFFPAVDATLEQKYGHASIPYGNFVDRGDPTQGWRNRTMGGRYSTNYVGLRNIFTVLDENYAYADFKTRVLGCLGLLKSMLEYTSAHGEEMAALQRRAMLETRESYHQSELVTAYEVGKLLDLTVASYELIKEKIKPEDRDKYPPWYGDFVVKKTDVKRDYEVEYFAKAVPTATIPLPEAYLIMPFQPQVIANLKAHGVLVETVTSPFTTTVEQFVPDELKLGERLFQGHIPLSVTGSWSQAEQTVPAGATLVSMRQPLARLIPVLLEPLSEDSLLVWGFFNTRLVAQWTGRLQTYPILRLDQIPPSLDRHLQ
jgi:hypothetical protein